eukprot:06398.XXX_48035_46283_1 [CDS] Oithona nana genome sequencing.
MHTLISGIFLLGLFCGQTLGQSLTLRNGIAFPSSSPTITALNWLVGPVGPIAITATNTNTQPVVILSSGYNENTAGIPVGLFSQASGGTMSLTIPASTTITVFLKYFDVPDSSATCTNQYVRIKTPSASLDLCNGVAGPDDLVSVASSTSGYTLEISFQPNSVQRQGTGFLIFVSTYDSSSLTSNSYTTISTCTNTNRKWIDYIYATSTVADTTAGTTACKTACTADANCQLMVRKSTACYLGRFDIADAGVTKLSVTDSAPDSIQLRQGKLLNPARSDGPLNQYTMNNQLFNNVYGIYGRIPQSPIIGISEAECAARCSLNCDDKSSGNVLCHYYLWEKKVCYIGNFGIEQDEIDIVTAAGYVIELPCDKFYIKNSPTLDVKGLLPTGSGTCTSVSTTIDVTSSTFTQTLSLSSTTSGSVDCQYSVHRSLAGGRLRLASTTVTNTQVKVFIGTSTTVSVPICQLIGTGTDCTWTDANAIIQIKNTGSASVQCSVSDACSYTGTLTWEAY